MGTHYPDTAQIAAKREWLLIDLDGLTVGRAASKIAGLLRGKHKTHFTPHLDVGDFVVCINAEKVVFTGDKLDQQEYHKYTGSIGHMRTLTAREMLAKKPEVIIQSAVKRMLPRGPLGRRTFEKLKVYAGPKHPHEAQNPKPHKLF
jgi:large subunit ribosomal protein L13